jgi:4-alpha-glucanotransferase
VQPAASKDADALRSLANAFGVDTEFHDWHGELRVVSDETLRAVLAALDVDATTDAACRAALAAHRRASSTSALPPCVVVRAGRPQPIALPAAGARMRIELEDGTARELPAGDTIELPIDLPLGYHRLDAEIDGRPVSTQLVVTPDRLQLPATLTEPGWGLATQLYSVRSSGSWGIGDLADLSTLADWSAARHGADFVLVNPVHAAEVVAPMNPSPYLPTSRRFANPLYLRIEDVAEYAALDPAARAEVDRLGAALRTDDGADALIERDPVWAAKLQALQLLFAARRDPQRDNAFRAFRDRSGEELERFARWCALSERHGPDWHTWPVALRDPRSAAVAEDVAPERVTFFCWLQWLLDEQLAAAQERALAAGMRIGVIHDVAVGVSADGADAWSWQDVMAAGVTVGAPPDAYSQMGQDWNQPPWRPDRLAELAYAPLRDLFANALRHGGGLRVDHIIGLFRLWWIPTGAGADAGTYVHYDHDAIIGILALEAERAGAVIIGEDLGNVEPRARSYLRERGLLGTSILWFESDPESGGPLAPDRWREYCLASVTTHDLPPTTGYLAGDHIRLRDRLGLLTRGIDEELAADEKEKAAWIAELTDLRLLAATGDPAPDELVTALHRFLTLTPARLRCVALTDAVGERRTQNQPGTSEDEYPNWRIPLGGPDAQPVLLDELVLDERVAEVVEAVRSAPTG